MLNGNWNNISFTGKQLELVMEAKHYSWMMLVYF